MNNLLWFYVTYCMFPGILDIHSISNQWWASVVDGGQALNKNIGQCIVSARQEEGNVGIILFSL